MGPRQRHQDNRAAWNEAAHFYEHEIERDVAFLRAGGKNLMAPELHILADLGSWCRRAIHLQCAGGRDTLSLWNHGAAEVVGIDISDVMIRCARAKSEQLAAPAHWYCCDLLDAPAELNGTADLVYTGRGALNWLMDIEAWAAVVARLLRPHGGRLYVFEGHPLDWVLEMDRAGELRLIGDYFNEPIDTGPGWPPDYIPAAFVPPEEQQAIKHERLWTLGQIMNALVRAGLQLELFEEHPDRYWAEERVPEPLARRLPHTFSLVMRRNA